MFKKTLFIVLLCSLNSFAQVFDYKNYSLFLEKYVSENGSVNYQKISTNNDLDKIINQFEKNIPSIKWNKNEKLAYYINLYNIFTIKTINDNFPLKSIKDITNVWDKKFISIAATKYSLNDIEDRKSVV